jgi:hypothetical protein
MPLHLGTLIMLYVRLHSMSCLAELPDELVPVSEA